MADVTFHILPDAREDERSIEALNVQSWALRGEGRFVQSFLRDSHLAHFPPSWGSRMRGVDPTEVLRAIARVGWVYPVLVVHRSSDDNRWSHALIGLKYETMLGDSRGED